jgi:hypothetical protein
LGINRLLLVVVMHSVGWSWEERLGVRCSSFHVHIEALT